MFSVGITNSLIVFVHKLNTLISLSELTNNKESSSNNYKYLAYSKWKLGRFV